MIEIVKTLPVELKPVEVFVTALNKVLAEQTIFNSKFELVFTEEYVGNDTKIFTLTLNFKSQENLRTVSIERILSQKFTFKNTDRDITESLLVFCSTFMYNLVKHIFLAKDSEYTDTYGCSVTVKSFQTLMGLKQ